MFAEDFAGRILSFEARAAARYPEIVLERRQAGNPIEKFDALSRRRRWRPTPASPRAAVAISDSFTRNR
jgi:hypothetical protein